MSGPVVLSRDAAEGLVARALQACDTSPANARSVARALVAAEVDGQGGHGLSRVASYAAQSRSGKVDGHAEPAAERVAPALARVDARYGFAYPALDMAIPLAAEAATEQGIGLAAIFNSHHFGQAGAHCMYGTDGRLIYVTCSLLADENEVQIETFLSDYPGWRVVNAADIAAEVGLPPLSGGRALMPGTVQLTPGEHGTDAFFVAVLERSTGN